MSSEVDRNEDSAGSVQRAVRIGELGVKVGYLSDQMKDQKQDIKQIAKTVSSIETSLSGFNKEKADYDSFRKSVSHRFDKLDREVGGLKDELNQRKGMATMLRVFKAIWPFIVALAGAVYVAWDYISKNSQP